jgi:hypothetical protein
MAAKKTAENAGSGQGEVKTEGDGKAPGATDTPPPAEPGKDAPPPADEVKPDAPAPEQAAPKGEGVEAMAAELKSVDMRPTAEDMFANFMIAVAGRSMAIHQPVGEIADTAERLTAEWLSRKDKFAGK